MRFGRFSKEAKVALLLGVIVACLNSLRSGEEAATSHRRKLAMSVNLGGGECILRPALQYDDKGFPTDATLTKTIVAGHPSGNKRLTFLQLEALTGLSARDEWDFMFLGTTNQPFIKANYPHHEGIWGWGDIGDQVIMVVSDIKKVMIEYHDILWDIGYAQTFDEAYERIEHLYSETQGPDGAVAGDEDAPVEDFLVWRDLRVLDEIHWYSWFIDYYMESGLMRDMFNHEMTVPSQWHIAMMPNFFTKYEMRHGRFVDENVTVSPSYDPMCATLSRGCYPALVVDPEKLIDVKYGAAEARKLAELVQGMEGFDDWLIDEEAWECIWHKLIIEREGGIPTFLDRDIDYDQYAYSFEMKNEMWHQINRLITKYENEESQQAQDLIEILTGHRDALGVKEPVDPISYEQLMTYHLAFPPFFPNQKPFESDDDFFVNTHEKFANVTVESVESIIDRRRAWFVEEMAKKQERAIIVKYYDATGWTSLPPSGLDSLSPYMEDTTYSIKYTKTLDTFAGSGKVDNVAALFQGNLLVDSTVTRICVTSDDGSKVFIDDQLVIDNDGLHDSLKLCSDITPGLHKVDVEYFNGGKYVSSQDDSMRMLYCGVPGAGKCSDKGGDEVVVSKNSGLGNVRCCAENAALGWKSNCETIDGVFAKSKFPECYEGVTFDSAVAICASKGEGTRLCSPAEYRDRCTKNSGCEFNTELNWACAANGVGCANGAECCSGSCDGETLCYFKDNEGGSHGPMTPKRFGGDYICGACQDIYFKMAVFNQMGVQTASKYFSCPQGGLDIGDLTEAQYNNANVVGTNFYPLTSTNFGQCASAQANLEHSGAGGYSELVLEWGGIAHAGSLEELRSRTSQCSATHEEMQGTDVRQTSYFGLTEAEKDLSCCQQCTDEPQCEFWVRDVSDNTDGPCWLKKDFSNPLARDVRRGAFRTIFAPVPSGDRVVPPRSWASPEGVRRHLDLITLDKLLEQDLRNLKETDIMGPWTRAEFNKRRDTAAGPSVIPPKKYKFSTLDRMLSDKMKTIRESGKRD